jgi:hypothetical protein
VRATGPGAATTSASGGSSSRRCCSTRATRPRARRSWARSSRRCARRGLGAGPWLPPQVDAEGYGRAALSTSMRWELRPEPKGRADQLGRRSGAAGAGARGALDRAGGQGELAPVPDGRARGRWSDRRRVPERFRRVVLLPPLDRARDRALAEAHGELRGWLEYIVQKASRHSGPAIELTSGNAASRCSSCGAASTGTCPRPARAGGRTRDAVARVLAIVLGAALRVDAGLRAAAARARRRRGQEGIELPARASATSSCTADVGDRAGRARCCSPRASARFR